MYQVLKVIEESNAMARKKKEMDEDNAKRKRGGEGEWARTRVVEA